MAYTKYPTWKQLNRELEKKELHKIYCFIGEEEGEKDRAIASIGRLHFGTAERESWDLQRFHAEDDLKRAVGSIVSTSMFSTKSLVVLYSINRLQVTTENKMLMREMVTNIPPETLVVLTNDDNRLPSLVSREISGNIQVYHFWKYFESDIIGYINRGAKERGFELEENVPEMLFEMVGSDTRKVDSVLDQLMYASINGRAGAEDIKNFTTSQPGSPEFEFIDLFYSDDRRAYEMLEAAVDRGISELLLLTLLFNQAERIEQYHDMRGRGISDGEIFKALKITPGKQKIFSRQVGRFAPERVQSLFPEFHRADYALKSTGRPQSLMGNPMLSLLSSTMKPEKNEMIT